MVVILHKSMEHDLNYVHKLFAKNLLVEITMTIKDVIRHSHVIKIPYCIL